MTKDNLIYVGPKTQGVLTNSTTAVAVPTNAFEGRKAMLILNNSDVVILIGGNNTINNTPGDPNAGYPLAPNASIPADVAASSKWFAKAVSGTDKELRIMELR